MTMTINGTMTPFITTALHVNMTTPTVSSVNGTTATVPSANGTTATVPSVNGTTATVPSANGTTATVQHVNGTTATVPPVNGTTAAVPPVNGTTATVPVMKSTSYDAYKRLYHMMTQTFPSYTRPLLDQSQPLILHVTFNVNRLVSVNEIQQTIDISAFLNFTWFDEVRTWKPAGE